MNIRKQRENDFSRLALLSEISQGQDDQEFYLPLEKRGGYRSQHRLLKWYKDAAKPDVASKLFFLKHLREKKLREWKDKYA